jgi:hypothetical protein
MMKEWQIRSTKDMDASMHLATPIDPLCIWENNLQLLHNNTTQFQIKPEVKKAGSHMN